MHFPTRNTARYLFAAGSIMAIVANPAWISSAAAAGTGQFVFTGSITGSTAVKAGACLEVPAPMGFDFQMTGRLRLPVGPAHASQYLESFVNLDISAGTLAPEAATTRSQASTTNTSEKGYAALDIYVRSLEENYAWNFAKGSIVTHGGSGSINIAMVPEPDAGVAVGAGSNGTLPGPGDVHIRGSWNC
jgi:hypothetical protein